MRWPDQHRLRHPAVALEHTLLAHIDDAGQLIAPSLHRVGPILRSDRQGVVNRVDETAAVDPVEATGQARAHLSQAGYVVVHGTGAGGCRRPAGDAEMHHGRQGIEVGPGALAQLNGLGVLLNGRKTGFEDGGERLGVVADHMACCAQVEQHRARALATVHIVQQEDVVRGDVTVKNLFSVQAVQGAQYGLDHLPQPGFVWRHGHLSPGVLHGLTTVVRHHHVGGAVRFPEAVNLDQRGMVKARQQTGLVDEGAQAKRESLGMTGGAQAHTQALAARGQGGWHVLFDGDLALQRVVERRIHDAETAHAQHALDFKFTQAGAVGQGIVLSYRGHGQ